MELPDFISEKDFTAISTTKHPSLQIAIKLLDKYYSFISKETSRNNFEFIKEKEYLTILKVTEYMIYAFTDIQPDDLQERIDEVQSKMSEYFHEYTPDSTSIQFSDVIDSHKRFFEQFRNYRAKFKKEIPEHDEIYYLSSLPVIIIVMIIAFLIFVFGCLSD